MLSKRARAVRARPTARKHSKSRCIAIWDVLNDVHGCSEGTNSSTANALISQTAIHTAVQSSLRQKHQVQATQNRRFSVHFVALLREIKRLQLTLCNASPLASIQLDECSMLSSRTYSSCKFNSCNVLPLVGTKCTSK